jgi:hypothetical protein
MSRSFGGGPQPDNPDSRDSAGSQRVNSLAGKIFASLSRYKEGDELSIEPVQIDLGKRLVAGLIDVMTGYVLQLALNCVPLVNVYMQDQLPLVGYLIVRDALFNGRGVGKNLMGLQVVDIKTGAAASLGQSIKRNIVIFWPFLAIYLIHLFLKFVPNEMFGPLVTNIVIGAGTVYTMAVVPYEAWRVYARADSLRLGDKFAGTATVLADMDFSNPLSR